MFDGDRETCWSEGADETGKEARRYERHRGTDTERFAFYHMFVAAFDCDCVQGVWWIYSNILERQLNINKGIPLTGYTPEEVSIIVRKNLVCPLVEEIGEDEQGSMFFSANPNGIFPEWNPEDFILYRKTALDKSRFSFRGGLGTAVLYRGYFFW